jgi:hypothetical protein
MSGWLDLLNWGLAPNQKHQAFLGAPKIVHCGERFPKTEAALEGDFKFLLPARLVL